MTRRRPTADGDGELDRAYAEVPNPNCKGLCAPAWCSSLVLTTLEQQRIAARHGVRLPLVHAAGIAPTVTAFGQVHHQCIALDSGRCSVYPDRPMLCRLAGAVDNFRCPYECEPAEGLLPAAAAARLLARVEVLSERAAKAR